MSDKKPKETNITDIIDAFKDVGEDIAVTIAIKREELWEKGQINDRLAGAAITAKFGLAGLKLAPVTVPIAAIYGFVKGPKIVKSHDEWLKKQKEKRQSNTPK